MEPIITILTVGARPTKTNFHVQNIGKCHMWPKIKSDLKKIYLTNITSFTKLRITLLTKIYFPLNQTCILSTYREHMRIIHGGIIGTLYTIPFCEFQLQLVPLIIYSAIAKTILVRSLIFHIFTLLKNRLLKQRLKQKRRIILKYLRNIFSFIK